MTMHGSSAATREATPHATEPTSFTPVVDAFKKKAQSTLNDPEHDPCDRALLRYAIEVNDPWLASLVRQLESDQTVSDELDAPQTYDDLHSEPPENKIEVMVDLICRPGDEPEMKSRALVVLLSVLGRESILGKESNSLANTAKSLAFAHCGDMNFDDILEARIADFEADLLAANLPLS